MSETDTPDSEPDTASKTEQVDEPIATIHLEGPARFKRSLGDSHSVTAIHEDVWIEGTMTVDQETLFEVASPESALSRKFILKQILDHGSLMDGYTPTDADLWDIEFQASVEEWKALTADVRALRPYHNGESRAEHALKYLAALANEDLLGDSGLMTILELGQDPDVSFNDRKRTEILDELRPNAE